MFCDSLKKGRASIREIIMNETYNLTETDISLLSYYLGIPIVMLYQGRNRFKLATYKNLIISNIDTMLRYQKQKICILLQRNKR